MRRALPDLTDEPVPTARNEIPGDRLLVIIFETHATSLDNEMGLASGQHDVELSGLGTRQAAELGQRYRNSELAAVFCSDLRRSYATAEIAFAGREVPVIRDNRLRECDYGILSRHERTIVDQEGFRRVKEPFPGGESYGQCAARMKSFLSSLLANLRGKRVLIIGHRATWYGLEHWIEGRPLAEIVGAKWRWQPGWTYHLTRLG